MAVPENVPVNVSLLDDASVSVLLKLQWAYRSHGDHMNLQILIQWSRRLHTLSSKGLEIIAKSK